MVLVDTLTEMVLFVSRNHFMFLHTVLGGGGGGGRVRMASLYLCVSAVETFCTHYVYVYTQLCFNTFILNHSMSAAKMSLYTVCLVPNWFSLPFRLASFKIG